MTKLENRLDDYLNNSSWGVSLFAGHRDVLVKEVAKFIQSEASRIALEAIGEDEDHYSDLPKDGMAYQELKRIAGIANLLRAEQRAKLKALTAPEETT